jgi:hypothetical protein
MRFFGILYSQLSGYDPEGVYAIIGSTYDHGAADQQILLIIFRPG